METELKISAPNGKSNIYPYSEILKVMADAIVVIDRSGIIVSINQQCLTMFGYEEEEVIGNPIEILVPITPEVHQQYRDKYMRHPTARNMGSRSGLTAKRKDGFIFPVDISLAPLYLPDIYIVAAIRDTIEVSEAYEQSLLGWARALDIRDNRTATHSTNTVEMTVRFCRLMGFDENELIHITRGAILHDIGKMGVSDLILKKSGALTPDEYKLIKQHPIFAKEMLEPIRFLKHAIHIPYCHHEHWDGTGYPRGLRGAKIPLEARIFTIIDVYEALLSDRVYRKAWTRTKAMKYIKQNSGKLFDPILIDVFLKNIKEIEGKQ